LAKGASVEQALPIGCVLTLPATGSESNGNSVVTRYETKQKLAFSSPRVYPQFAILDPTVTYSLPPKQVANGVVDAFVHVME
ncbi:iron-containing alcohol dehydrogenase, partial [Alishewanella sp. SMS9]|nr:iron-containing alcohol dehydrogenase [Alishewanella sp. SMS9]